MKEQGISRGKFIGLAGGITLLTFSGPWAKALEVSGIDLVSTPQLRLYYTIRLLKKLVTDIGPRPSGSRAYAKGAKIILQEMKRSLSDVNYDIYDFDYWELLNSSDLIIGGQHIEAVCQKKGLGTPNEGIRGVFIQNSKGFAIIDELSSETLAIFSINQYGKAIAGSPYMELSKPVPVFGLGKQDIPLLERSAQNKLMAFISADVRTSKSKGINVIGRIPGKSKNEILIISHADTIFNTPGANDNTSSVIVMLMLVHAAAVRQNNHTLTFVASDSEEYNYEGAYNYAEDRIADNTLKNIRYVLNFDSLTYGPNLWISSKDQGVKDLIREIHKDLNIDTKPIFDEGDGYVMDSLPFRASGAKALHANSRGYDEKTLPVYHRPDDTADKVPLDCVEISFLVFDEFIRRIDKE
ncbi:Peptidase family M28 [Daejeonella rubra]|uniref:Peptidase family M28 n=1 Tax=Daejeonella rubra TaxID=990371 RepID=A0A1G9Y0F7_9SPHI|nr:M28 family peptidase [Daejeonella rubra]SDN02554.1 Peptidase family M28 [Daejeonella rubra]